MSPRCGGVWKATVPYTHYRTACAYDGGNEKREREEGDEEWEANGSQHEKSVTRGRPEAVAQLCQRFLQILKKKLPNDADVDDLCGPPDEIVNKLLLGDLSEPQRE